jgi:hypothetical protein
MPWPSTWMNGCGWFWWLRTKLCRICFSYIQWNVIVSADQTLITIELNNLREKWNKIENDVRRKRRAFRNWYRDNKNFAVDYCPELFHYLPDFRNPGSILGDGGFADMAKVFLLAYIITTSFNISLNICSRVSGAEKKTRWLWWHLSLSTVDSNFVDGLEAASGSQAKVPTSSSTVAVITTTTTTYAAANASYITYW